MSNTKKTSAKGNVLLYVALAFIAGFLSGAAFAVYQFGSGHITATGAGQSEISRQQQQAIAHLEQDVAQNPEKFQSWTQLGNLYFDTGQHEKAIEAYQRSLSLHAGDANIWTDLGVMYRRTGQPQKAVEAFDKAIAIDPRHETSRLNKGIVLLYDLDDPQGAIDAWESLLAINPAAAAGDGQSVREYVEHIKQDLKNQGR